MSRIKSLPQLILFSLCLFFSTPAYTSEPTSFQHMIHAVRMGAIVAKQALKLSATLLGVYWFTGYLLGNCQDRPAVTIYPPDPSKPRPPLQSLKIYTEGTVTVKPSSDNTIKVTHIYGANERSALTQIKFKEIYNYTKQTLTIEGLLGTYKQSFFEWLIERIFKVRPKRKLHHVIEIPSNTPNIDITIGRSEAYVSEGQQTALVDSILAKKILVHAYQGNVRTTNNFEVAPLRKDPSARGSICLGQWQASPNALIPGNPYLIEIHTPGKVTANNIPGNLEVFGATQLSYTFHIQNTNKDAVSLNGETLPYKKPQKN